MVYTCVNQTCNKKFDVKLPACPYCGCTVDTILASRSKYVKRFEDLIKINMFNSIFGRSDNFLSHKPSTILGFYADGTVLFTKINCYLSDSLLSDISKWFYKGSPEIKSGMYSIDERKIFFSIEGNLYNGIIVNKFTITLNSYVYTYRGFIRDRHFVNGIKK